MKAYSITTPIYYINDLPHLGTAYTTVLADVLARFHRSRGEEVFFLTGTDENGEKIIRAAQDRGLEPRELVDLISEEYKKAWADLNISYDRFIRTTDDDHVKAVQAIFSRLQESGDIYKDRYEGWYCVPDETFVLDAPDGRCPECGRPMDRVQREAYFFALSRYGSRLLEHYERRPEAVQPEFRRNEVVRFIQDGLRDMCITRTSGGWGIPVPDDPDHVIYVWFDALVNYLAAAGYPDDLARMECTWPPSLHVVGKDILVRFHATLWPAMLMGCGLPLPQQILAHGWLLMNEKKMSKSLIEQQLAQWRQNDGQALKVTSLRPTDMVQSLLEVAGIPVEKRQIAVDALRYFLIRDLPAGADAEFSLDRLVDRYNSDLANDLGNLLNRTLSMLHRYRSGLVPAVCGGIMVDVCSESVQAAADAYEGLQPADAILAAWRIISAGNHLIDDHKPWILFKQGQNEELDAVLYACGEACRIAAVIVASVMPSAAAEVLRQLGLVEPEKYLGWNQALWGQWTPGTQALTPEPIFPRIEAKKRGQDPPAPPAVAEPAKAAQIEPAEPTQTEPAKAGEAEPAAPATDEQLISYEDFQKLQLRVATIKQAERVKGAKKLLRLVLDVGGEDRQIAAGIAEFYEPEALIGRQIVVLANLAPRTIRGIESQGMLLAADPGGGAILLQPDAPVPPGSSIH